MLGCICPHQGSHFLTPGAPGIRSGPRLAAFSDQPPKKIPCEQKKISLFLLSFPINKQRNFLRPDILLLSDSRLVEHLLPFWNVLGEIRLDSSCRGASSLPGHVLREVSLALYFPSFFVFFFFSPSSSFASSTPLQRFHPSMSLLSLKFPPKSALCPRLERWTDAQVC